LHLDPGARGRVDKNRQVDWKLVLRQVSVQGMTPSSRPQRQGSPSLTGPSVLTMQVAPIVLSRMAQTAVETQNPFSSCCHGRQN
jgi:hypothetical protein